MDYDKNSFLAGLSVGKTLKGWASGATPAGSGGTGSGLIYDRDPIFSYRGRVLENAVLISGEYIEEE